MNRAVDAFDGQFAALAGRRPFRWQRRLFGRLLEGNVPAALDLPTGLGKTSVMTIWLTARAHGARLPRRLVYVVDRRAVVDQATEEAEKLRDALEGTADHFGDLDEDARARAKQVAAELKERLGFTGGRKLPISTLRGAHVDNREWLDNPAMAAIIVGTIDMIGSRLLFEGYGVSRKMRPYQAGLLGADTLVVLDEAHLVPPFDRLLQSVAGGTREFGPHADDDREIIPPFKLLSLSATGRTRSGANDFTLRIEDEDLSHRVVEKRLAATKTIEFVKAADTKDGLADALAEQASTVLAESDRPLRCLVYCDSREVAEKVRDKLGKIAASDGRALDPEDTELFVGARRVRERDGAKSCLQSRCFVAGSSPPARSAALIATSAGEVGIDLDADHMVCDLVPWERMVQRFGRVNRRGESDATIVVVHGDEPKPKKPDAPTEQERHGIVGFRALTVFEALLKLGQDGSPGALRRLKLSADTDEDLRKKIDEATTPEPLRPALTRPLVEAWSLTALEAHTGRPEIAPWLRGWIEEDEPQTAVVWRKYLPVREEEESEASHPEIEAFFEAAPPHASELLETETWRVIEWLTARARSVLKFAKGGSVKDSALDSKSGTARGADLEPTKGRDLSPLQPTQVIAFALDSAGTLRRSFKLGELADDGARKSKDLERSLREAILVVDARLGGLTDGLLNSSEESATPAADSDRAWVDAEGKPLVGFRIRVLGSEAFSAERGWQESYRFDIERSEDEGAALRLVVEGLNEERRAESRRAQLLAEHRSWTELKARQIANGVGLTGTHAEVLAMAARLHDEGKRANNWQRAFNARRNGIYAKTTGPLNSAMLAGYRHEFGSLPFAEDDAAFQEMQRRNPHLADLVLHLIATHHGGARPVISTQGCEDAPPSAPALQRRARDVALRFAQLQKRWGPWGLAWWEALLRAADQQASRDNDEGRDPTAPSAGAG
jgi:CRISPR-associated endonuclease/helicase Cas3